MLELAKEAVFEEAPVPSDILDCDVVCEPVSGFWFSEGLMRRAFNNSIGKSATPIIILPMVPMIADAPPVIGSHGPSSVSYSRGRYLEPM